MSFLAQGEPTLNTVPLYVYTFSSKIFAIGNSTCRMYLLQCIYTCTFMNYVHVLLLIHLTILLTFYMNLLHLAYSY